MALVAVGIIEVPRLWRTVFPPKKAAVYYCGESLYDGSFVTYTLFDDGTYAKERITDKAAMPAMPPPGGPVN
jgi:hypothetical protein